MTRYQSRANLSLSTGIWLYGQIKERDVLAPDEADCVAAGFLVAEVDGAFPDPQPAMVRCCGSRG